MPFNRPLWERIWPRRTIENGRVHTARNDVNGTGHPPVTPILLETSGKHHNPIAAVVRASDLPLEPRDDSLAKYVVERPIATEGFGEHHLVVAGPVKRIDRKKRHIVGATQPQSQINHAGAGLAQEHVDALTHYFTQAAAGGQRQMNARLSIEGDAGQKHAILRELLFSSHRILRPDHNDFMAPAGELSIEELDRKSTRLNSCHVEI